MVAGDASVSKWNRETERKRRSIVCGRPGDGIQTAVHIGVVEVDVQCNKPFSIITVWLF